MKTGVYKHSEIDFDIHNLPMMHEPTKVLMCTPDYFDIVDQKNVYMNNKKNPFNKSEALVQWKNLFNIYQHLRINGVLDDVKEIRGRVGLEDMVFAANQTLPWLTENGEKVVVVSKMKHESRQREVGYFEEFFQLLGYRILKLQRSKFFEGMGDAISHPGKRLIYGGYGHRTGIETYGELTELIQTPIIALELKNPYFYHLDTCFVPLNADTVLICPEAFTIDGLKIIAKLFKNVIRIPAEEAKTFFSLNAHVLNRGLMGRYAIIQYGSTFTYNALMNNGFEIIETDTSEFMKSGGSVFCLKMMLY